jgi:thiopurine S-methyltransferase
MEKEFWLERWERQEIGFHQNEVNPHLLQHWQELNLEGNKGVFVPLCGKSLDLLWLREQGHAMNSAARN